MSVPDKTAPFFFQEKVKLHFVRSDQPLFVVAIRILITCFVEFYPLFNGYKV